MAIGDSENLRLPTTTKVSIYKVSVLANEAWGLLNKMLYGEAPLPRSNPLTGEAGRGVLNLLFSIFDRKGTPFIYLPLKNGTQYTIF